MALLAVSDAYSILPSELGNRLNTGELAEILAYYKIKEADRKKAEEAARRKQASRPKGRRR